VLSRIRWRGLRTRIIAWSFVPTAIILVAVALVTFYAYQQVTEELVIQRDREVTRLSAGQLATELAEYSDILIALARTADIYQSDPPAQRAALKRASNRLAVFDAGVLILDTFGTVVAAEPERPEVLGQDWSGRTYYREVLGSHTLSAPRPVFSDIVADGPGDAEAIAVAVPITGEQGELLGTMTGMFRLGSGAVSALYGDIVKLRIRGSCCIYLVDGHGRVIYHSDGAHIGEDFAAQTVVQQVMSDQGGAIRTRDFEGRDIVAGFAPVPGTPWGLVTEESWSTLTSGSRGYQQFLVLLLALGVVVPIVVVTVGVRRITEPIAKLIGAAQQVARGNFGQTISAQTGDEVQELAKQFNLMSAQLQESYAHLEQRVADRTRELSALNAIAAVVSRSLDLDEVLSNALAKTLEVTGIEAGGIYLVQDDAEALTIAAHEGLNAQFVAEIDNLKAGEGFSGQVVRTGEPLVVRDLSTDPRLTRSAVSEGGFHSAAIFPLASRGKVLGSLFVITHDYREFSQQDIELLTSIGHQIGVAIENARFFEAEQRRAEQFRVISEVGRRITSILAVDELLGQMAGLIKEALNYYRVGIGLIEGDELVFEAGAGSSWDSAQLQSVRLKVGREGITGWVAKSGEPLLAPDVSQEPRYHLLPQASETRSELAVPLKAKDAVIGVLDVQSDRLNAFDESDVAVLQSLAHQAAIAIDNARLFEETHIRAEELAVLNELGQALTARLNVEQVLDEAYRGVSRLLDTTNFYIALYNPDEATVTFALEVTEGQLRRPYTTRRAGRGLTEYIIRNRTPLLIEEHLPERLEEMEVELIGPVALSWLGVPLTISDQVLGMMAVQSYTNSRAYDEHDRDLLTAIASQVAIAIQNARLFEEASSRAERLAVVNRIASAASATLHLRDLMETVYQEIVPAFKADAFFIALYDEEANELDFCFQVDEGVREAPERRPLGTGLTSIVVTEKKPLVIRDEQERDRLLSSPQLFGTMKRAASWLGAPMLVGERVIGVISVQSYRSDAWCEEDQLLLFTIADQIAVALENARLFAEAERRMQDLEALYRADEELYRHLHLEEVLQTLVDVAVDILQADKSSMMIWDAQQERLVVGAARGFSPETMAHMSFAPGEGIAGRVVTIGEPAVVEDVDTDPRVARRITDPEGIRSFMHIPVEIDGQIFGVFNVNYAQPRAFGGEEQRLFTALAQRAALVIENAQLYEQAQELAVMEERSRLARDLHDAVTQTLFSASLIADVLPRLWKQDPDVGRVRLEEVRQLTRGALAEMRTLLLELRPAALVEAEMDELLRQLAEATTGRARVPVSVEVAGDCPLPSDVKVAMYRIVQEALNNIAKHAEASQATVGLCCGPELVTLRINDDGHGFDLNNVPPDHLGLGIMRERAEAIGAILTIESEVGRGTEVMAVWSRE
jgi:GAF domain-containing protein/HAMP domain-containing protein